MQATYNSFQKGCVCGEEDDMSNWNAEQEANKLECLAKARLDTGNDFYSSYYATADGITASKALGDEWHSLSTQQKKEVADVLISKYRHPDFSANPTPSLILDSQGELTGVQFDGSFWDFKNQLNNAPDAVKVIGKGTVLERFRAFGIFGDFFVDHLADK